MDGVETQPVDLMHSNFDRHTIVYILVEAESLVVINELNSTQLFILPL